VTINPDLRFNKYKVQKSFKMMKLDSSLGEFSQPLANGFIIMAVICVFIGFILLLDNYNANAAKNKMG
jgi:hypothetical protein